MKEVQKRRERFDQLHKKQGGFGKLIDLLNDYSFTYEEIAAQFGFSPRGGKVRICQLIRSLDLPKRPHLDKEKRRINFAEIYKKQGGLAILLTLLERQASDQEITEQLGIEKERVKKVLFLLGLHHRNFRRELTSRKLTSRENFDKLYKGGVQELERMASDPLLSLKDIAEHFGYRSRSGVSRALKKMEIPYVHQNRKDLIVRRKRFQKRYGDQALQELEEMVAWGQSHAEIARHLGVTYPAVRGILNNLGLRR